MQEGDDGRQTRTGVDSAFPESLEPEEPEVSLDAFVASFRNAVEGGGKPMVAWFAPSQLLRTGVQVAISAALGTRVDPRRASFSLGSVDSPAEIAEAPGGVWFDYVADVGDGFIPTYMVARGMARPTLAPRGWRGPPLPRGQFLLIGGDLCYPTASDQNYRERLLHPYEAAWKAEVRHEPPAPPPRVFAIPGNHDWYDGLVAFSRIFLQGNTIRTLAPVGGWQPVQTRSYFAIQLPHRWWLWGLDIQLESDINADQLAYFVKQAELLRPGDHVILCTAEPHWVQQNKRADAISNLAYLLQSTVNEKGAHIALELAGDLHHYRHHALEGTQKRHRIICGIGGAFTHPTHNVPGGGPPYTATSSLTDAEGTWTLRRAFPTARQSRALGRRVVWQLPFRNPAFCLGLGLLHTTLAWGFPKNNVGGLAGQDLASVLKNLSYTGDFFAATGGETWLLALGIPLLCMYGAETQHTSWETRHVKYLGLAHGLAHVVWAVGFYFVISELAFLIWERDANQFIPGLLRALAYLLTSSIAAGLIFGAYLRIAHERFHAHANELYSAIASPHYKGFLRLHIDDDGTLSVYPLGVGRTPVPPAQPQWTLLHDHGAPGAPIKIPGPAPRAAE